MIVDHGKRFEQPLKVDESGNMSTTDVLIYTVEANESTYDVYQHEDIPAIGEAHLIIPNLFCTGITINVARNTGPVLKYKANLSYAGSAAIPAVQANSDNVDWMIRNKVPFNYAESLAEYEKVFELAYAKKYADGTSGNVPNIYIASSWIKDTTTVSETEDEPVTNTAGMPLGAKTIQTNTVFSFSYLVRDKIEIGEYQNRVNNAEAIIASERFPAYWGMIKSIKQTQKKDSKDKIYYQIDISIEQQWNGWGQRLANIGYNMMDYNYKKSGTTVVKVGNQLKSTRIYTCNEDRFGLTTDNTVATGELIDEEYAGTGYGSQKMLILQGEQYYKKWDGNTDDNILGPKTADELVQFKNSIVPVDQQLPLNFLDTQGLSFKKIGNYVKYDVNYIDFLDKPAVNFDELALPVEFEDELSNCSYNRFLSETGGTTQANF